ncbi:hypothetical protein Q3G72_020212 [Acer saccharum]|nr:hypothetical protein Q3G72_020212 [Acer saccharum]
MADHHKSTPPASDYCSCNSQIESSLFSHQQPTTPTTRSPLQDLTMASRLRKAFDRVSGGASAATTTTTNSSGSSTRRAPIGRRMFRRHSDEHVDEFRHAAARCLSSYYSVFVARLAIMAMLAILIGLLTILTWHFTKVYTTKSLDNLAYGLRYELLQRPILRMWNILNSTAEITTAQVKLSEYVIRRHIKPANQAEQVELYEVMRDVTWALFASRRALNSITINYRNGFVQAFHRDHRSNNTFYIYSDLSNYSITTGGPYDSNFLSSRQGWNDQTIKGNISATWYREPLDPNTGEKVGKATPIPPDDLINIAGLSQVPDGVASWHVAVSKYTNSPLLSAALPVWDPTNTSIMAVVGVTTALYSVGQLMKELVEVHSGHIYLTSQEGYLLATSTNAPLLRNSTSGPKLVSAVDSEDKVIQMGAKWLQREYGNKLPPGHVVHIQNAKLGHEQYYMDSFFLNLKRLPIVGVIIIPRKYIMGTADERAFKTLIILISASVCILIIGCVCILVLTNGVSKEMKLRAELISHLDARRRAEASNNYKSQFLANMSHELRTPMAAVIGLLDILIADEECLNSEQFSAITHIRRCSTALLRLLNNILDLSKVESGKLVLEETDFDLGNEVEGLVDMFSVQCLNHNLEIVLDFSDDIPTKLRGDSARVVQIFANLINNSIKFTESGHIVIRGWVENWNAFDGPGKITLDQKKSWCVLKAKFKQQASLVKKACKKENKMLLSFEIDDTGCGIDPRKWESVFESFEQADPSTTRLHGGTGLGLCIVRTLVHKMGGEIKVVKKNGQGTMMQLYLLLSTPLEGIEQPPPLNILDNTVVLLASKGNMGRLLVSKWLHKHGVPTLGTSEWNELLHILLELFHPRIHANGLEIEHSLSETVEAEMSIIKEMKDPIIIVVFDIEILDFSSDIWKEQLNYLHEFSSLVKFAWMLNYDTPSAVKMELRRRGQPLVVNKPLYKAKMVHIFDSVKKELFPETQNQSLDNVRATTTTSAGPPSHQEAEVASNNSSTSLDVGETRKGKIAHFFSTSIKNSLIELTEASTSRTDHQFQTRSIPKQQCQDLNFREQPSSNGYPKDQVPSSTSKAVSEQKSLQGLRILVVEDTPLLQKVAKAMLERLGAVVFIVGDGLQAVDALNAMLSAEMSKRASLLQGSWCETPRESPQYDLILMDCQARKLMPNMDGYEATKEIRKSEAGTGLHIPIVALTAHAMSSDEAKCLSVGMDAYLTKPIDRKLMVSTILSLTQKPT